MTKRYQGLAVMQLVCALFVVLIHVGTITENPVLHFILKSMLGRVAVPLYFVSSAFFFKKKLGSRDKVRSWLRRFLRKYFWLSLLYLPLGLHFVNQQLHLGWWQLPFVILVGVFYAGVFYHLWYFPALLLALFLGSQLINQLGYRLSFLLAGGLYLFGSGETYFGYLEGSLLGAFYARYFAVFVTTKNGLFYGLIFALIGFYLRDQQESLTKWSKHQEKFWAVTLILWVSEGIIIYQQPGLDKNFLFSLIPLVFLIFCRLLDSQVSVPDAEILRRIGQQIYFYHLIPIELFNLFVAEQLHFPAGQLGLIRLGLGILLPTVGFLLVGKVKIIVPKFRKQVGRSVHDL